MSVPPPPKPFGIRFLWLLVAVLFSLIVALLSGILKTITGADLATATLAAGAAFSASMGLCLMTLTAVHLL